MSEIRKIDEAQREEIIYFELNNWMSGTDFPAEEPFIGWICRGNGLLPPIFQDREWVKENKLAVVAMAVDMSLNYCIAAPKSWILKNCPNLWRSGTRSLYSERTAKSLLLGVSVLSFLTTKSISGR